jgi:hypothetical protein
MMPDPNAPVGPKWTVSRTANSSKQTSAEPQRTRALSRSLPVCDPSGEGQLSQFLGKDYGAAPGLIVLEKVGVLPRRSKSAEHASAKVLSRKQSLTKGDMREPCSNILWQVSGCRVIQQNTPEAEPVP